MPVYEYQGKHYDLSETDPAAAKTKIQGFLEKEKPSQAAAFGKSAFESAGSAAGGLAGAEAGLAGGAALGAMTGPFAPVAVPALGLAGGVVGGLGGGYAGEKIQEKLGQYVPESVKQATGFSEGQRKAEKKEYPTTSMLGRIAPDVAVGGKALYDFGKLGYRSAKDLAQSLLQKKTAKSQAELAQEAERLGYQGQQTAASQAQAEQKAAEAQRKKLEADAASQQTKAAQAETAGQKATAAGGRTLRELTGVRTLPEAGGFKPIPQTVTEVGNFIRQQAENFVKGVKAQRDKAAKTSFSAAKNDAAQKQALGQFVDTQPIVNTLDSMIAKGGSSDYIRSLETLKNDLAVTKDFEGLEVIRRRLGDAGFGLPEEGYKAIGQGFAKDMYKSLSGQMKSYSKNFEKYLDDYKRLSQNLEAYGSRVGKGITQTQDAKGLYYAKTAEQIAKDIFSSPEKFKTFVDAVGGNRQIADAAARRYFAGLAEKATTPKAVEDLLRDNRALLNEVPSIRQELTTRYLEPLRQSSRRSTAAESIQKESTKAEEKFNKQIEDVDIALSEKLEGIESGKTIYSDAINTLSSAKPGKAVEQFDSTVLPRIRDAEQKAGVKLIDESQIQMIRKQVQQLDQIADKARREVVASQIAAGLFGLGAAYGVGKKTVEVLGGQ
jgi:hypothetical protein